MIFAKTFKIFLHLIQGKVSLEIIFEEVLHEKKPKKTSKFFFTCFRVK